MNPLINILLATGAISLISLIGVFVLSRAKSFGDKSTGRLVSFAAGVLLATSILSVLPEAFEGLAYTIALKWFLIGIVGAFLIENILWWHHHHSDTHNVDPTASLIIFGDGVHNFIDGLAIAAAFIVHPSLGLTATIAIAAHEIPQEIADYGILRHTGLSRNKALMWNFISALTAVVGGVIGFWIFQEATEIVYYALAITAGLFLYISTADLIPELHHNESRQNAFSQSVLFIVGILLMAGITMFAPHTHEHSEPGHSHEEEVHEEHDHEEETHENELHENEEEYDHEEEHNEEEEHDDHDHE